MPASSKLMLRTCHTNPSGSQLKRYHNGGMEAMAQRSGLAAAGLFRLHPLNLLLSRSTTERWPTQPSLNSPYTITDIWGLSRDGIEYASFDRSSRAIYALAG